MLKGAESAYDTYAEYKALEAKEKDHAITILTHELELLFQKSPRYNTWQDEDLYIPKWDATYFLARNNLVNIEVIFFVYQNILVVTKYTLFDVFEPYVFFSKYPRLVIKQKGDIARNDHFRKALNYWKSENLGIKNKKGESLHLLHPVNAAKEKIPDADTQRANIIREELKFSGGGTGVNNLVYLNTTTATTTTTTATTTTKEKEKEADVYTIEDLDAIMDEVNQVADEIPEENMMDKSDVCLACQKQVQ